MTSRNNDHVPSPEPTGADAAGTTPYSETAIDGAGGAGGAGEESALAPTGELEGHATTSDEQKSRPLPANAAVDTKAGGLGSLWVALAVGAILTILILIFVLQNQDSIEVQFLPWQFTMPSGIVILLAAIAGALLMALVAAMRILQLRHRARKSAKVLKRTAGRGRGRR